MVRFATEDDPGFISVVGEIERWAKEIKSTSCKDLEEGISSERLINAMNATGISNSRYSGGITIWGNVVKSNVVYGSQTINGGLSFGD
jgi:hypothetical protein